MVFENFKEKLMNKSDSYKFYKNEYEKSIKDKNKLEKQLNKSIKKQEKYKNKLDKYIEKYEKLKIKLDKSNNKSNGLEIELNRSLIKQNELQSKIDNYKYTFSDIDEFFIKLYNSPFILSPFSREFDNCIKFMNHMTKYLTSKLGKIDDFPLISVIMPVYNRKDVVMNAINSVLNQTYENFELIIVDDASTDGSAELLKEIKNEKISVIMCDENGGSSYARNKGLKLAKGEYIAYLDSDNIWCEDYLSATIGAFVKLPDADAVYSAQFRYSNYNSDPEQFLFAPLNKSLLHNMNFIDLNSFAHKKSLLEKSGNFDETLNKEVDWDLILRISRYFKIYSVPFVQTKYYMDIVDNRVSDIIPSNTQRVREKNEFITAEKHSLNKKVNIIIPIDDYETDLEDCINSIMSLKSDNIKTIISTNNLKYTLSEFANNDNFEFLQSDSNNGFFDLLNDAIKASDSDADILILSSNALLSEGSIEMMQKYSYELTNCGMAVSQNMVRDVNIKKHVPHADNSYWCDIAPSTYLNNIINIPTFHNGEILELKYAPFFCSYIKREVINKLNNICFDFEDGNHVMELYSQYIRNILGLKIYHLSNVLVKNNK